MGTKVVSLQFAIWEEGFRDVVVDSDGPTEINLKSGFTVFEERGLATTGVRRGCCCRGI